MTAFATVEDLARRYRPLDMAEQARADVLLADAAAILEGEFRRAGKDIDETDEALMGLLGVTSCSMVARVIANGDSGGLTSVTVTAGSFSEQKSFANPSGDMYLTKAERRLLGIPLRRGRIGTILPAAYEGRPE